MKKIIFIFIAFPCLCIGDELSPPNYPKISPTATKVYELQSNKERTHFFVDGKELPSGRRVKVLIDDNPHTVVAKPEKCASKEEYIQPPYNSNAPLSFTFMMDECSDSSSAVATNPVPGKPENSSSANEKQLIIVQYLPAEYSKKTKNDVSTQSNSPISDDSIFVLIEGHDDGERTNTVKDRDEATLDAKRQAIERSGIRISSNLSSKKSSTIENGKEKYSNQQAADFIESQSDGVLLPGYQLLDKGYQSDGTYLVILSGKVKVIPK